jgi:hypothetical protein
MDKPLESHWNAQKGVIRYLKGTLDYGIKYTDSFDVELLIFRLGEIQMIEDILPVMF